VDKYSENPYFYLNGSFAQEWIRKIYNKLKIEKNSLILMGDV